MSEQQQPRPDAGTILNTTRKVGQAVMDARRDLAATHGVATAILDLIQPGGEGEEGENPVLEMLEQVLLALRHQGQTLDEQSRRLEKIEQHLRMRR